MVHARGREEEQLLVFGGRVGLVGLRTLPSHSRPYPPVSSAPSPSWLSSPLPSSAGVSQPARPDKICSALVRLPPRRAVLRVGGC